MTKTGISDSNRQDTAYVEPIRPEPLKVACSSCNLRELCLPVGLSPEDLERLDGMVATRKHVPRGDALFRSGDRFQSLYAVRTGFFKTCVSSEDGRDQVTGFQMAGELLGLDGIGSAMLVTQSHSRTRRSASYRSVSSSSCRATSARCSISCTAS
jgi:CRP-like cAMP-binding protein